MMNQYKKLPFPLLYEDNHLLVVFKPANFLAQKDQTGDEDMLTVLKAWLKIKDQKPNNVYLGLVHRLDRMTSGVMVFAKTSKAASRLSEQIRNFQFEKKYLAIVEGIVNDSTKTLEDYLLKDEEKAKSKITNDTNGKLSKLSFRVISYKKEMTLLDINLFTGRHHQIRVQLSHLGHPIVGDVLYGSKIKVPICLVAYYISFFHPITKEKLAFTSFPKGGIWDQFPID